jgi:hypothetical protein
VGDQVSDAVGPFGFVVTRLEPERLLAYTATIHPLIGRPVEPDAGRAWMSFSWVLVLEPTPAGGTRMLVRVRYRYGPRWVWLPVQVTEIIDAISSPKTMEGIKRRAERLHASGDADLITRRLVTSW